MCPVYFVTYLPRLYLLNPLPRWGRGKLARGAALLFNAPLSIWNAYYPKASPPLVSPLAVTTQALDRAARHLLRCERPLPGNYPHTVLGCSRGVKPLLAGDSKGVSPLIFIIRKEKRSKNQAKVAKIRVTNISELAQHAAESRRKD
jgi:hypothetical protein